MGIFREIFFGAHDTPIASCVSESTAGCSCTTGRVNFSGHLICSCGNDHGRDLGPNRPKRLLR